jgi:IS30 family transposase
MDAGVLEQYLRDGLSLEQIGELTGRHPSTVGYWVKQTRSIAEVRAEVAKCVLLCANCHAEVEGGIVKAA